MGELITTASLNLLNLKLPEMKKIALFVGLLAVLATAKAQTADEIISKHIEAMGGKEKLLSIKSIYMEGTSVMQNGAEISQKTWKVDGKLYRQEINSAMFNFAMVVTDKEGWRQNPRNGGAFEAMTPEQVANMQIQTDCAGAFVNYAEKGHKAELIGKEDVEGVAAYKIKITYKSGNEANFFFDANIYLIIRMSAKGGGGMGFGGGGRGQGGAGADTERITDFSDYKKTDDGFVFAYKITPLGMGGGVYYEKIEVNKPIDPKAYKPEVLQ
jgi:outer membrane lipoprotein-sorting protein